ncbi:MAG: LysM peptidoglycan-binding domain-containing protein [Spirochaetia bacterium]|nr:LysM peptidoglycan-binding domain-containing protein [Spirochaetia bacterium]
MNRFSYVTVLVAAAALFAQCAAAPVKEMTSARTEVASAEEENAAEHAKSDFAASRTALAASHQSLVEESFGDARDNAGKAFDLAIKARSASAPKFTAEQKKLSEDALAKADSAYAEELAKDDFEAAKKLMADGATLESKAASDWSAVGSKPDAEKKAAAANALSEYRQSYRKYQASRDASVRARNVALAQKDDLLASVTGLEATLAKVEAYGGTDSDEYKAARAEVDQAKADIQSGSLKSGNARIVKAEGLAASALAASASKQAEKKLSDAKAAVKKAGGRFDSIQAALKPVDDKAKKDFKALSEHMSAAREAVAASEENLKNKKFDDSVKESDEAMKLAAIIMEQTDTFAMVHKRSLPGFDANSKGRGGVDVGDTTTVGDLPQGYKVYVVQRKKPEDCLWMISVDQYGVSNLWSRIHSANKGQIKNPNLIKPGQRLAIPPKQGEVKSVDPTVLYPKGTQMPGTKDQGKKEPASKPENAK